MIRKKEEFMMDHIVAQIGFYIGAFVLTFITGRISQYLLKKIVRETVSDKQVISLAYATALCVEIFVAVSLIGNFSLTRALISYAPAAIVLTIAEILRIESKKKGKPSNLLVAGVIGVFFVGIVIIGLFQDKTTQSTNLNKTGMVHKG
ncbi:membrane protein [Candidatus Magnetobacterium bavaricum]|uniref:Membrane protein n=1 Tax=Candidatus Magnetobacterium bavaricum TaxID=29290 RepID=A0A0F3GLN6_9BACT|nr:membrane protein [Candidatus Magnetobacterium bavaricum]